MIVVNRMVKKPNIFRSTDDGKCQFYCVEKKCKLAPAQKNVSRQVQQKKKKISLLPYC